MKSTKITAATILIALVLCVTALTCLFLFTGAARVSYRSLNDMSASVGNIEKGKSEFFANTDEALLKKSGLMGTIVHKDDKGKIYKRNLYTMAMEDSGVLSTDALSLAQVDYTPVEQEIKAFAVGDTYVNQQLQNYCLLICYLNYRNHNRVRMEIEQKKQYVDGSKGIAPYFGMWDIVCEYNFVPLAVGLDRHRVEKVQALYAKTSNSIDVTEIQTSNKNATVTISNNYKFSAQIGSGITYDAGKVVGQLGNSFTFEYGGSKDYMFEYGSATLTGYLNWTMDLFQYPIKGKAYNFSPNGSDNVSFNIYQRIAYVDGDATPDDLFVMSAIGAIKIDGKVFAPDYSNGNFEAVENFFGTLGNWSSDNYKHTYLTNFNGMSLPIADEQDSSNLNKDIWDHTYEYGYY